MKKIYLLLPLLMLLGIGSLSAQRTISGTVTDDAGQAMIGATVLAKGTTAGKVTDVNGRFTLDVPAGADVLVVSYTGYLTQEVSIAGLQSISIVLQESPEVLTEIVVTGYSEIEAKKLISSVAVVGAKQLENIPMTDVNQLIQGRAAGVYTTANSGQPGAGQPVRIRGTGSINAGRGPLYVVDGIIVEQGDFTTLASGGTYNAPDVLAQMNPNDIETVTVLKDASATALYGSRGSNGVIVITTKRGKIGKTDINVKAQKGVTLPNFGNFELMTPEETWNYERQILANSGRTPDQIEASRPASMLDNTTDWVDEAFNKGHTSNLELQARGGNEKTRFFASAGIFDQQGTQYLSDFNRLSLRSNIDHYASDKLSFELNVNGSYSQSNNAVDGNRFQSPMALAFTTTPLQGKINPATGELYSGLEDDWIAFAGDNFLYSLPRNPVDVNTLRLISKLAGTYKILENLAFTQSMNVDFINVNESDYDAASTNDGFPFRGQLTNALNQNRALTSQSKLRYFTNFGQDHSFDALGVFEYQNIDFESYWAAGQGFASEKLRTLASAAEPQGVSGTKSEYAFVSWLGQANYSFKDRYMLTASLRRDGSSRFGANNRWANFWSVGGSWRISEEVFLQDVGFLSNLRLRASYGTSGNADIGNFVTQELYGFGAAYLNEPGSSPSQIGNPDLTWEKSKNLNVGLDFGILNNRVSGSVEYYDRRSEDLLLSVPVSSTSGFTTATQNVGKMKNSGVEVVLNLVPVKATRPDGFNWDLNFNISFNNNEILELPNGEDILNGRQIYRVGQPIRSIYIQEWAGVNPDNGTPQWLRADGTVTGTYSQAARSIVGNAEPTYIAGLNNTFSFKGFALSAFFYTAQGHQLYNASRPFIESDGLRFGWAHSRAALEGYWQNPGDNALRPQPRVGGNAGAANTSTRYMEDASFIRLRNVQLAYSLPSAWVRKAKLQGLTIYGQGQNLWTMTDYTGFDPEANENGDEFFRYPVGKAITFGIDVTF
ncbi:MAG: TonB-dependent receptor [Lewinellaceae bacterium]|nr:TonB-dependent receptor [Lewinellaceae bacterium]